MQDNKHTLTGASTKHDAFSLLLFGNTTQHLLADDDQEHNGGGDGGDVRVCRDESKPRQPTASADITNEINKKKKNHDHHHQQQQPRQQPTHLVTRFVM